MRRDAARGQAADLRISLKKKPKRALRPFSLFAVTPGIRRLFLCNLHLGAGALPLHAERTFAACLVKSDRELFNRCGRFRAVHRRASQVFLLARIVSPPFARLLADDEDRKST